MSRLDDELRRALIREEPSADFTERVMQRIAAAPAPAPKKWWWDDLLSLFQTPRLRWAAVGLVALLILLGFASQRWRSAPVPEETKSAGAKLEQAPETPDIANSAPKAESRETNIKVRQTVSPPSTDRTGGQKRVTRIAKHKSPKLSEGEIAKEKLMLALHIASASLNEAQRLVEADK
jgi:hypothetical protein